VKKKKITIITSSRADFGLLNNLILTMSKSSLSLSVVFTGTHFNKNFGNTVKKFKSSKKIIVKYLKVKIISDQNYHLVQFKNRISSKLNNFLYKNKTNLIVVLGDRFEMLECAFTSYLLRIPIAHIHGGEVTNGSYDDAMRHAITKLSNFHFVSHNSYKKRIIQLGEIPKNIFCVGSLGIENIKKMKFLKKRELENKLNIKFRKKNLVITYHPVNKKNHSSQKELKEIFKALKNTKDTSLFFSYPGLENGFLRYKKMLHEFASKNNHCYVFKSLGHENFLSLISQSDGLLGNSSSGILEVASLKKAVINIGDRQSGREQSVNIINCKPMKINIIKSIRRIYSASFAKKIRNCKNIYYKKNPSKAITSKLLKINLSKIKIKKFQDI